ncbi:MAG: nucleotidyltransferase [Mycobacteriaceae bacterium]|nr:nucleotidyltransferase [Mycobacteriaceae bacterium]MBV9639277.1 nucleotidyltransferase [Mycobacteriaceae bacterium]
MSDNHRGYDVLPRNDELRAALKRAASALKEHGPEFALAGSYALWAYGGPEPVHDVDFVVAEPDAEAAAVTLRKAGFRIDRTPEDWLFKACAEQVVVDVLHRLNGVPVDAETIRSARLREVLAVRMPVLSPTQVVTEKLGSLNEHHCDFAPLLLGVRAVREQVDWDRVRAGVAANDFAVAFLLLIDRLGITA